MLTVILRSSGLFDHNSNIYSIYAFQPEANRAEVAPLCNWCFEQTLAPAWQQETEYEGNEQSLFFPSFSSKYHM